MHLLRYAQRNSISPNYIEIGKFFLMIDDLDTYLKSSKGEKMDI